MNDKALIELQQTANYCRHVVRSGIQILAQKVVTVNDKKYRVLTLKNHTTKHKWRQYYRLSSASDTGWAIMNEKFNRNLIAKIDKAMRPTMPRYRRAK